jgi:signal transduction histidine kinase
MTEPDAARSRLLDTLQRLLEAPAADLTVALSHAADAIAQALNADKVDAFLYDPGRDSLVAVGVSHQPLSGLQQRLGLDVLPLTNGGRVVHVFQTGVTFMTGRLDQDREELRGVREAMAIRSKLGVPLEVAGQRRGVIMIASLQPHFFTPEDARFAESVTHWVGTVAHRAELITEIARNAVEQGRRAVADELITVLAHDLRNYLSPIDVRLRVIRRRAERDRRASDVTDADHALRAVERLGGLISDILDVARIDQGVLAIESRPIELVALIEETAGALATPDHALKVQADEELVVAVDPARIRQCLENLLSNAIKHSPKDAAVTIEVGRFKREDGEWARVEVVDQGPGVPLELMPRIFDRFVTGKRGEGGLGLGLFLAKRIAALHGGDLTVDSEPGKGARFALSLPCAGAV